MSGLLSRNDKRARDVRVLDSGQSVLVVQVGLGLALVDFGTMSRERDEPGLKAMVTRPILTRRRSTFRKRGNHNLADRQTIHPRRASISCRI